ncbi:MAG: 2-isopropylmalate synthase, partial [Rhodocyclales bacterium]|nr:2-isopropylmalate synthase [Rhodocyclales bacterium]
TDAHGGEMSAADIWQLFSRTYLDSAVPVKYVEHHLFEHGTAQGIRLTIEVDGTTHLLSGEGNGPIDAAVHALRGIGAGLQVRSYEERSMGSSSEAGDARACAFIEIARPGGGERYGVGIDGNIVTASIKALISGVNRMGISAAGAAHQAA